jgi:cell division protease FtsH
VDTEGAPRSGRRVNEHSVALAREWRRLGRAATFVAVLTSPALFILLYDRAEWPLFWSLAGTVLGIAAFRGLIDVLAHKLIPAPSLYGAERELRDQDVVSRRRLWYWRRMYRRLAWIAGILSVLTLIAMTINAISGNDASVWGGLESLGDVAAQFAPIMLAYLPIISILFFANFMILFGPLLLLGVQQIKGYEPGDADWGVKLADVRGQAEAKEEITRVVSLWQSGEAFEKAGGKRERGVLFLGAPGTGKTMLSQGIATSFNCPL